MTETRTVVACVECQVFWDRELGPASCTVGGHTHQLFEIHRHRTAVVLPDATEVIAVSFDAADPYTRDRLPDYGLYLDPAWQPPWPHEHLDWPDAGIPRSEAALVAALTSLWERAREGQRVEVGCLGAHGRTGTVLACLVIMMGGPPEGAVAWVRSNYCLNAVENAEQEAFVAGFTV
jgi:hypothetical protein